MSGLNHTLAKGAYLKRVPRVRFSPSPPFFEMFVCAAVAQLDRASDYGSEGLGFKSLRLRHFFSVFSLQSAHFLLLTSIK